MVVSNTQGVHTAKNTFLIMRNIFRFSENEEKIYLITKKYFLISIPRKIVLARVYISYIEKIIIGSEKYFIFRRVKQEIIDKILLKYSEIKQLFLIPSKIFFQIRKQCLSMFNCSGCPVQGWGICIWLVQEENSLSIDQQRAALYCSSYLAELIMYPWTG